MQAWGEARCSAGCDARRLEIRADPQSHRVDADCNPEFRARYLWKLVPQRDRVTHPRVGTVDSCGLQSHRIDGRAGGRRDTRCRHHAARSSCRHTLRYAFRQWRMSRRHGGLRRPWESGLWRLRAAARASCHRGPAVRCASSDGVGERSLVYRVLLLPAPCRRATPFEPIEPVSAPASRKLSGQHIVAVSKDTADLAGDVSAGELLRAEGAHRYRPSPTTAHEDLAALTSEQALRSPCFPSVATCPPQRLDWPMLRGCSLPLRVPAPKPRRCRRSL
jgi:hypothetical protein